MGSVSRSSDDVKPGTDPAPSAPPEPRFINLEITDRCNMSCPMCMTRDHMRHEDRSLLNRRQILDHVLLPGRKLGLERVVISGGEPTLVKDLFATLSDAAELGYTLFIATNLLNADISLFTDIFALLDDCQHTVQVSFDSKHRDVMKQIRGVDSFERVDGNLRALAALKKRLDSKIILNASIIIQEANADSVLETVDYLLYDAGVDLVTVQARHDYANVDIATYRSQPFPDYPKEIVRKILGAAEVLFDRSTNGEPILLNGGPLDNWVRYYENPLRIRKPHCNATYQVYIDPFGRYRGCLYAAPYSNVLELDLASYLTSDYYQEFKDFVKNV